MKIDIAVYTAQEGYAWQPGTAISADLLKGYKARIGKFPSPDAVDFPFGGVFLEGDRVVFYRYHVAKKIDFRGRDALYCVLGTFSKGDAAQVDPKTLFALPEFAGVAIPFPTQAEVPVALPENVPGWLKNLEYMSLDVRISGSAENMKFAVKQEQTKIPEPPKVEKTIVDPKQAPCDPVSSGEKPVCPDSKPVGPARIQPLSKPVGRAPSGKMPPTRPWHRNPLIVIPGAILMLVVAVLVALVLLVMSLIRGCGAKPPEEPTSAGESRIVETGKVVQAEQAKAESDPAKTASVVSEKSSGNSGTSK